MGTHYESLGVSATADSATIRAAYLRQARLHHPDRNLEAAPAARARSARAMRDANAAWEVLGDPSARRDYDLSLAAARRAAEATRTAPRTSAPTQARRVPPPAARQVADDDDEVDVHPAMGCGLRVLPAVVLLVVLLGIFVYTAFASQGGDDEPGAGRSPGELLSGDCVVAGAALDTVPCSDRHNAVVMAIVPLSRGCPANTSVYPLEGARLACLRPVP